MSEDLPTVEPLDRATFDSDRKELIKYQQAAYDSYEKTLTALVGSTLALSVAFLAFLQSSRAPNTTLLVPGTICWLYATWALLIAALFSLVACFFVNARAFSVEMKILADALTDGKARNRRNAWGVASLGLYGVSALTFCLGILALLYFCHTNLIGR